MKLSFTIWLLLLLVCDSIRSQKPESSVYSYRLAFGSCFRHRSLGVDSSIFKHILKDKPNALAWLGDFAYLDYRNKEGKFELNTLPVIKQILEASYNDPNYVPFRKSTKIYGVWDDHDSGINDSDKSNNLKEELRQLYLDYMEEPADSPRRSQPGGMYASYFLDPHKQIKLIMLDVRYSRDVLSDPSISFEDKSLLGAEQEEWFVKELRESDALFTLVAIGNQFIPDDRPLIEVVFPRTRNLILTTTNPKTNIFLITGDVHYGEMLEDSCTKHIHGYPIQEFTSSGLTHSVKEKYRFGLAAFELDFRFPETFFTTDNRYVDQNYGIVDFKIDLSNRQNSTIDLLLKGKDGQTIIRNKFHVETHMPKLEIPDMAAYKECLIKRGSPEYRRLVHMIKKIIDPTGIFFYLLAVLLVLIFLVFLLVWKVVTYLKSSLLLDNLKKNN